MSKGASLLGAHRMDPMIIVFGKYNKGREIKDSHDTTWATKDIKGAVGEEKSPKDGNLISLKRTLPLSCTEIA